jgi:hypothetical protein
LNTKFDGERRLRKEGRALNGRRYAMPRGAPVIGQEVMTRKAFDLQWAGLPKAHSGVNIAATGTLEGVKLEAGGISRISIGPPIQTGATGQII